MPKTRKPPLRSRKPKKKHHIGRWIFVFVLFFLGIGFWFYRLRSFVPVILPSIDLSINGDYLYTHTNDFFQAFFIKRTEPYQHDVMFQTAEGRMEMRLTDPYGQAKSFSADELIREENQPDQIVFRDLFLATDVSYSIFPDGLKEEIILQDHLVLQNGNPRYYFYLTLDGVRPMQRKDGALLPIFLDEDTGAYAFHFERPRMEDRNGDESFNLRFWLESAEPESGRLRRYRAVLIPSIQWLRDSDRMWPVRIDPTILIDADAAFLDWNGEESVTALVAQLSAPEGSMSGTTTNPFLAMRTPQGNSGHSTFALPPSVAPVMTPPSASKTNISPPVETNPQTEDISSIAIPIEETTQPDTTESTSESDSDTTIGNPSYTLPVQIPPSSENTWFGGGSTGDEGSSEEEAPPSSPDPNPLPQLTALYPQTAFAGGSAFTLRVSGDDFQENSAIRWDGINLTGAYEGESELIGIVPADHIIDPGEHEITVFTPEPGGGSSNPLTFTIQAAVATGTHTITAIDPISVLVDSGPMLITVYGEGFNGNCVIRIGSTVLETTYVNDTKLTGLVPRSRTITRGVFPLTVYDTVEETTSAEIPFNVRKDPRMSSDAVTLIRRDIPDGRITDADLTADGYAEFRVSWTPTAQYNAGSQMIFMILPTASSTASLRNCSDPSVKFDDEGDYGGGSFTHFDHDRAVFTLSSSTNPIPGLGTICIQVPVGHGAVQVFSLSMYTVGNVFNFGEPPFYLNDSGDVNVFGVRPSYLEFNIYDSSLSGLSHTCAFGTVVPNVTSTCAYRLRIVSNAVQGFVVQMQADAPLNAGYATITQSGYQYPTGEAYGMQTLTIPSFGGRNPLSGAYTEAGIANASYQNPWAPIPFSSATTVMSYTGGFYGTSTLSTPLFTHGLYVTGATPSGSYQQNVTFIITPTF